MSKTASTTFTTQLIDKPDGVGDLGGFVVTLFKDGLVVGAPVTVADNSAPVEIVIDKPGAAYTVQVARVSATGEAIAAPSSSAPFDVAADQVLVPLVVTVTLGDAAPKVAVPVDVTASVA